VDAYITTTGLSNGKWFNVLVPHVREVWLAPDRNGRLAETSGKPRFLTEQDRERWIAAGRPPQGGRSSVTTLSPERPLDLPTNPDALYAQLEHEAQGNSNGVYPEMFTLIGDSLRETATTPAQRAALYEVAARLPGVQLLGTVHDSTGRAGTAVALDGHDGIRVVLVLDPRTSSLLEEQQITLPGNSFGVPAGEQIGYATYLVQAVVDSDRATP
jgi:hypothetical protein